ncbi:MAG: FixH family protein [Amylibacter sp.]|nr:FixH family protein [Amylibacter sp.]
MSKTTERPPLTGRKVTWMFLGAFATILGANLALIYAAIGSFPGLETRAPYNESLTFESRRIAQEKLNWSSSVSYKNGQVILDLTEATGTPVVTPNITVTFGRATSAKYDQELNIYFDGRFFVADVEVPAGNWQVKIKATALDGTDFRRTLSLYIRPAS